MVTHAEQQVTTRAERHDRAMGSDLHVIVWARGGAAERFADLAVARIDILEDCWSRFRPHSELTRLNERAGSGDVVVSDDLRLLVHALVEAWAWSDGDVDASVLGSMVALGYDTDFSIVTSMPTQTYPAVAARGMADVVVADDHMSLPADVGLDPGALGKGLAGDIVTEELMDAGADAVLVSLGGDVVTRGCPPDRPWRVALRDDRTPERVEWGVVDLDHDHAAVATSSVLRRSWAGSHHIVDPRTGSPVCSDIVQAIVVADSGWRAEAAATVAIIRGSASAQWLAERGCTAYLLTGVGAHA
jgi:FAD:protein FMN transferase